MAGHQPAIFHSGVWFKNFALAEVGRQCGALPINLVIDNDVAGSSSIRVPTKRSSGSEQLSFESIAYDRFAGGVPYEQTRVDDRERFDQFDQLVVQAVKPLVPEPSVVPLWKHARDAVERCGFAGCALAQARHAFESTLGLQTLEVPLGVVCKSVWFASFALKILADLPQFQRCYNDAADLYRAAHSIRSKSHPVPNLRREGEWFEAPFWLYGNLSPQRKAVWVRDRGPGNSIEISDRDKRSVVISSGDTDGAAEQLFGAMTPEFKLRSRALVTTMYARLVLSDLFLHGIGGGKYDQLGDQIIRDFFNVAPPQFMVVSATIHLPGAQSMSASADDEIRQCLSDLRDTQFAPHRFVNEADLNSDWLERRSELLETIPSQGSKLHWHREMRNLNASLSAQLNGVRGRLQRQLSEARRRRQSERIWLSREHPFCVFSEDYLLEQYQRLFSE